MDVLISIIFILATCIALSIIRWVIHRRMQQKILEKYGIPGPKPEFFLGNLSDVKSDPVPNRVMTNWLKEYGDVFGYYIGDVPYVVIKDLEMLKQIMIKDFNSFADRDDMMLHIWPSSKAVVYVTGKRWKEVRSILTPTFSSGKIKLLTSIIEKKIDITIDIINKHAQRNEVFDIYSLVQGLTLDVIADCALAMKTQCQENQQDIFLIAVRDFVRLYHTRIGDYAIMFPFVKSAMLFLSNYLKIGRMTSLIVDGVKAAIEARRKDPNLKCIDVLQLMLDNAENEQKGSSFQLTDEEIIANAYIFLIAGYETTATALGFTLYLLVKHPEIQRRLQQEIDEIEGDADYTRVQSFQYLDQVFNEALRFYPPVTGFILRKSDRDYKIGSYTIPKDAIVQSPVWDIHHDPELWPDPWKFDPDRFSPENKTKIKNLAFCPFGIGPRNCIGARFAQLEAKFALYRLLKKFTFEICEQTDDPLTLTNPHVLLKPKNGVFVRARLRYPEE